MSDPNGTKRATIQVTCGPRGPQVWVVWAILPDREEFIGIATSDDALVRMKAAALANYAASDKVVIGRAGLPQPRGRRWSGTGAVFRCSASSVVG
jgi:hypothetical protein